MDWLEASRSSWDPCASSTNSQFCGSKFRARDSNEKDNSSGPDTSSSTVARRNRSSTTTLESELELERYLGSTLWPHFADPKWERIFIVRSTAKKRIICYKLWKVSTPVMVLYWSFHLWYVPWSEVETVVAIREVAMAAFLNFLVQLLYVWYKGSHLYVTLDTKVVLFCICWSSIIMLSEYRRLGIVFANDPAAFKDDANDELSIGLCVVVILALGIHSARAVRSWLLVVFLVPMYGVFLFFPGFAPHTFLASLASFSYFVVLATAVWFSSCQAECHFRLQWLRSFLLSDEVSNLHQEVSSLKMVATTLDEDGPWSELAQATENEDAERIYECQLDLAETGFDLAEIERQTQLYRKKFSEESGVSVAYLLSDTFLQLVQERTGASDPTFYDIADVFFNGDDGIGKDMICPRDGQKGCSLLDTLPKQHRRKATYFLSWLWRYRVTLVRQTLKAWVQNDGLDPDETFVFMCFFVNNQYRMGVNDTPDQSLSSVSTNLDLTFECNLRRIGRMVAILDDWEQPHYLKRIWTIFEQLTAIQLRIPVRMILPTEAVKGLLTQFDQGTEGILRVRNSLSGIDCKSANATFAADEEKVKKLIESTVGYDIVDETISGFMIKWIGEQVQTYMSRLVKYGRVTKTLKALKEHRGRHERGSEVSLFSSVPTHHSGSHGSKDGEPIETQHFELARTISL